MTCDNHKSKVKIYKPKISTWTLSMTRCKCGQFEVKNDCVIFQKRKPESNNDYKIDIK